MNSLANIDRASHIAALTNGADDEDLGFASDPRRITICDAITSINKNTLIVTKCHNMLGAQLRQQYNTDDAS